MKQLQKLLIKPMSRREFLAYLGALVLAVSGIRGLLSTIHNPHKNSESTEGYGNSYYGGE